VRFPIGCLRSACHVTSRSVRRATLGNFPIHVLRSNHERVVNVEAVFMEETPHDVGRGFLARQGSGRRSDV
jgi:hypothetical protein